MKIGIITQARMTSTRLPGKILKQVNGISMLAYHVKRLKDCNVPLIVATTINDTDKPIVEFCKKEHIPFFRGDEQHVLSRFYECAKQFQLDIIVRVTSDCPLIDGEIVRKAIGQYLDLNNDNAYLSSDLTQAFPLGFGFEIFGFRILEEAYQKAIHAQSLEHVTPYFYKKEHTHIPQFQFDTPFLGNYRVTLDTPEDFELIKLLITKFQAHKLAMTEILVILDKNPKLKEINQKIKQVQVDLSK